MFKLALSPTFWAKVAVELAAEKGGKEIVEFDGQFKRMTADEHDAFVERIRVEELTDRDIAREVLIGWRGIAGDDNQPLPFNEQTREQLLDYGFGGAIGFTFFKAYPKAKVKN